MQYNHILVEHIRSIVEEECLRPTSKYGYEPYPHHFVPMARYAEQLSNQYGGNIEIILISAWLHDIGSIVYGRQDHHISGTLIAQQILAQINYPQPKINLVKQCIRNHRGSVNNSRNTIEEQIVAEADVMSNFDNISGLFANAYLFENLSQEQARKSVREKLKRKWQQLHFEESKLIIRPKYEAAMLLLK